MKNLSYLKAVIRENRKQSRGTPLKKEIYRLNQYKIFEYKIFKKKRKKSNTEIRIYTKILHFLLLMMVN